MRRRRAGSNSVIVVKQFFWRRGRWVHVELKETVNRLPLGVSLSERGQLSNFVANIRFPTFGSYLSELGGVLNKWTCLGNVV